MLMNKKKVLARNVSIHKVPNTNAYRVTYKSNRKGIEMRFNSKNNARSYVRRNLLSVGHYGG